jgi:hypothetical protein
MVRAGDGELVEAPAFICLTKKLVGILAQASEHI